MQNQKCFIERYNETIEPFLICEENVSQYCPSGPATYISSHKSKGHESSRHSHTGSNKSSSSQVSLAKLEAAETRARLDAVKKKAALVKQRANLEADLAKQKNDLEADLIK